MHKITVKSEHWTIGVEFYACGKCNNRIFNWSQHLKNNKDVIILPTHSFGTGEKIAITMACRKRIKEVFGKYEGFPLDF